MLTVQSFTFNPVQENTYVLYNEKGDCCIIDPGCYFASEEQALTNFIEQNSLTPILLLNTHCHLDHIFGNRFVHRKYNLLLHLHPEENRCLTLALLLASSGNCLLTIMMVSWFLSTKATPSA
jgi:glyoxylase-like metal-dependent hydrolase (beta-lactamase superfamily II)